MPLYEYLCSNCSNRFEKIVKFSDPPITTCPSCGQETVEQLLSAPAVQFKGSGWYVTDYAKKNSSHGSSAPATSSAEGSSESKSETKSDTKTEPTKSDTKPASTSKN